MKVNVTLDDELLSRIDSYADKNYMSRSGLISLACTQFLVQAEAQLAIKEMAVAMRKIADTGKIDDVARSQLEDFERIAKMLTGGTL